MKQRGGHDRVFLAALTFSFLLHLSMVTVFRIVVTFPREPILYYDLSLVEASERETLPGTLTRESLEVPSASDALKRLEVGEEGTSDSDWPSLPSVALPRLSFSELDLIRLSQTSLDTRSQYKELFEEEPDDLWAQFGRRLSSVGELLTNRRRSGLDGNAGPSREFAGHPAPGVDIYVEWMTPPFDRQMLVLQPIDALWDLDGPSLEEPIVLVVRVNAQGRVTFVQMPLGETDALLSSAAGAMFRSVFEPLEDVNGEDQHATVIIEQGDDRR